MSLESDRESSSHCGDRDSLVRAIGKANIPTLLMVLVQLTGDTTWLSSRYRPSPTKGLEDNDSGDLPAEVQEEICAAACESIRAWQGGRPPAIPSPSEELMVQMLSFCMGDEVTPEYGPMLCDDLERSLASFGNTGDTPAEPERLARHGGMNGRPPEGFSALIIGSGISGLCAAVKLQRMGVDYTIVEQADDVGGTWREHQYPNAGVDTPSHLYSYSFAPYDWSQYFALRDEIVEYLQYVASAFQIRPRIQFKTEVCRASYNGANRQWEVEVRRSDGSTSTLHADVLVSAVGAFNPPLTPAIQGLDSFRGSTFHTARWPSGFDVAGKKVAVVGNGASAMQVVPAIAGKASEVTVFQRSPQWAQPFPKFMQKVPDEVRHLFREIPFYYAWYRLRQTWIFHDKLHESLQIDPSWPYQDRSLNEQNDFHRKYLMKYIRAELGERTDLLDDVVPAYPPFGKRMLLDNGWFRCLTRDDVQLVTESVDYVEEDALVMESGEKHVADVIVFATGFDITRFVSTFEVYGKHGRSLREIWDDDDCRAYLGMMVPEFPNFFCLYGPNTQPGHGGSLITTVEKQVHYLGDILSKMFDFRLAAVDVRPEVYDAYTKQVDDAHSRMVWTNPRMRTYYRNSRGRVVVNSPFRNLDFWKMTRNADLNDYITEPRADG